MLEKKKVGKSKSRKVTSVDNVTSIATLSHQTNRVCRPTGRNKPKKDRQKKLTIDDMFAVIMENQERLLSNLDERLQLIQNIHDPMIMEKETAKIKDSFLATRYAKMQEEIRKGWEKAKKAKADATTVERVLVEAEDEDVVKETEVVENEAVEAETLETDEIDESLE